MYRPRSHAGSALDWSLSNDGYFGVDRRWISYFAELRADNPGRVVAGRRTGDPR
jgi:hypothetical protein